MRISINKNNIHVPVGVSQVSQLVAMILLINDCYVMSLVVIISRMNFVLYRNIDPEKLYRPTLNRGSATASCMHAVDLVKKSDGIQK